MKTANDKPKFTAEERIKIEEQFESVLNMPFNQIKFYLDNEIQKMFPVDHSGSLYAGRKKKSSKMHKDEDREYFTDRPADGKEEDKIYDPWENTPLTEQKIAQKLVRDSEYVNPLTHEANVMLHEIYQHSDEDLREMATLLAIASNRFYIINLVNKYNYSPSTGAQSMDREHYQDFMQVVFTVFTDKMPNYKPDYNVNTYIIRELKKQLGIEQQFLSGSVGKRYDNENRSVVNKNLRKFCAEKNISQDDVNPEALWGYIRYHNPKSKMTLGNVIKALEDTLQPKYLDAESENAASAMLSVHPGAALFEAESVNHIYEQLDKLNDLEKCITMARIAFHEDNNADPTKKELYEMVKQEYPDLKKPDFEHAEKTAKLRLGISLNRMNHGEALSQSGTTISGMERIKEESDNIIDALDNASLDELDLFFE